MQGGTGKGTRDPLPPQGLAVGAQDQEGRVVRLGHPGQGLARQAGGGFQDHFQPLGLQFRACILR